MNRDPFLQAVRRNELDRVRTMLADSPELATAADGQALRSAAALGHVEVVSTLLDAGANPNLPAPHVGWNPLAMSVFAGQHRVATLLRSRGAEMPSPEAIDRLQAQLLPKSRSSDSAETAFLRAAVEGASDVLQAMLIANPQLVRASTDKGQWTALHYAAQYGHLEAVRLLLDAGADVNAQTYYHESPMLLARQHGHQDVWELLQAREGEELP